ncbi:hypothetical protein EV378_1645 [Pseudonocardia endophytica]|uniref:Secreted protein n=2 Tax=Pseudonocardia endophytica TaxID=401976 RepID=A0A4R1HY82_PSEEN|nr:hypothetical protein EV378_1645 [Pseudonocardia endophytica]
MSRKLAVRAGRLTAGAVVAVAVTGLGGGVAFADEEPPDGVIQQVGGTVSGIEESTGVADISDQLGDATGLTDIENQLGVTKAEEGLGLG